MNTAQIIKSRILTLIPFLSLLALVLILSLFDLLNFDIWWHLRTGKLILETGTVPRADVFSFTAEGNQWITHEWASEILFFLIHKFTGISGLIWFKALVVMTASVILLRTCTEKKNAWDFSAIALPFLPVAFLITFRAFVRPHIFTWLFLSFYTLFFFKKMYKYRYAPLLLLFIQLIWANIHSGFIFGIFTAFVFTLSLFIKNKFSSQKDEKICLKLLVLLPLVALINPNLHHALLYPIKLSKAHFMQNDISELQPFYASVYSGAAFQAAFVIHVTLVFVAMLKGKKSDRPELGIITLVLLPLAITANRNIPIFAILTFPFVGKFFKQELRLPEKLKVFMTSPLFAALPPLILASLILVYGVPMGRSGFRKPGWEILQKNLPAGSVDFLVQNDINAHAFNTFAFGSYLIFKAYPDIKPFIDGRLLVYSPQIRKDYSRIMKGKEQALSRLNHYKINLCLLNYGDDHNSVNLLATLDQSHDWALVYFDDNSLVYLRKISKWNQLIRESEYLLIKPGNRNLHSLKQLFHSHPDRALEETARALKIAPHSVSNMFLNALAAMINEKYQEAEIQFLAVLEINPGHETAHLLLGEIYQRLKKFHKAEQTFRKAVELNPENPESQLNLGISLHFQGNLESAEKHYKKADSLNPNNFNVYRNLGILYAQQGRYSQAEQAWRKALEVKPGDEEILSNLDKIGQKKAGPKTGL